MADNKNWDTSDKWMQPTLDAMEAAKKKDAQYTDPYKWGTLAWDVGNLVARVENGYDEFWKYRDKSKEAAAKEAKSRWNTIKGTAQRAGNYLLWGAEPDLPDWKAIPTPARPLNVEDIKKRVSWNTWVNQWTVSPIAPVSPTVTQSQVQQWTSNTSWGTNATSQTPTFSSKEEVAYYLWQQPWWNNLTEQERVARVESMWQSIVNSANQNSQQSEWQNMSFDTNYNNAVMQDMQSDLNQSTGGTIYWKTTADSSTWITTIQDANSPYATSNDDRMAKVQSMLLMNPWDIANSLAWWDNAFSEQTITDVKRYAPDFWNAVQAELKKIQWWNVANAIASWTSLPDTWKTEVDNVNNWVNSWAESISWTPQQTSYTIWNTQNAMNNNQIAQSATQLISWLDAQIEDYKSKINNLTKEANSAFKWDVPQYVINAYINNRMQQYEAEIEKLEWRRQSALDLYKIELSNYQWGVEMDLKYKQFNQDVNNENWNRWYKEQQLNMDKIKIIDKKAYLINADWTMTQVADETAYNAYQQDVQNALQWYLWIYTAWWWTPTATWYKYNVSGGQCQAFTNRFTEMTTWLTMDRWDTAADKLSYMNTNVPVVWSVAIWVWWVYDSYYWHTMLVTWYDPSTWMIDLLWSNNKWDELVYTTHDSLQNLYAKGLKWFWDPYQDMIKAWVSNGTYWYNDAWVLITPMTEKFDSYIAQWVGTKSVATAERIYDTLYEISNNGELAALINSWDFWKMWAFISKTQFSNTKDDEWVTFLNSLNDYKNKYMAKEFTWWEASMNALNKLIRLVEAKLRKESWAVINSWEWRWEFELFSPRPWESAATQWDKLSWWDNYITELLRQWWMSKKTDYIPLFPKWQKREIF